MRINWKQKLTSRKFWTAVIGFAAAILAYAGAPEADAERITAIISAAGVLIAYILAEGAADASASNAARSGDAGDPGEKIKDPDK